MLTQFAKYCLSHGATITPLATLPEDSGGLGLCNPSVLVDNEDTRLIIRNVNFALWCSDNPYRFTSPYGPLCYMTRVGDDFLRTRNFLCTLNNESLDYKLIDTSEHDYEPVFEMAGHEDMRLVRWDGKLYGTGVQRDWDASGVGRMHLSELDAESGRELSRVRIKAPGEDSTYCEKNWMPVLDMPFHYVKWCNPFVLVKANPANGECSVVLEKDVPYNTDNLYFDSTDIRGSSQVVPWGDMRIAMVHRCRLWMNEKGQKSDTDYFTQFIAWDSEWNVVKVSEPFKFAGFSIEFTNGLAYTDGSFMIPFALQDNMCFMLKVSEGVVRDFIFSSKTDFGNYQFGNSPVPDFFSETTDSTKCRKLGLWYNSQGHYASAFACLQRACTLNTFKTRDELYECMYWCGMSLSSIGGMDEYERSVWHRMLDTDPYKSDAYLKLAEYHLGRGDYMSAYSFAKLAHMKNNHVCTDPNDARVLYAESTYMTEQYRNSEPMLESLLSSGLLTDRQKSEAESFVSKIKKDKNRRHRIL